MLSVSNYSLPSACYCKFVELLLDILLLIIAVFKVLDPQICYTYAI